MCNPSLADIIPSPPPPSSSSHSIGSRFRKPSLRSMAQAKEQSSSDSYDVEEPRYFLDSCYRCRARLLPSDDIYMYRGDTPFCSEECRQEQIEIDEAEEKRMNELIMRKKNSIKSNPKSGSHKIEIHVTEVAC